MIKHAYLVASGDTRLPANQNCWPAQLHLETRLTEVLREQGVEVTRAHPFDPREGHGFISSQRMGMDIFRQIPPDAPVIVAEAVWQYSSHVLAGLRDRRGPILTVANWSGEWPGLVGLLNLNGSLTKAGVSYSSLWSEAFTDPFFLNGLREWVDTGRIVHDIRHAQLLDPQGLPAEEREMGERLATQLQQDKAILGVFDEGCMGMYNAIIDDELLNPLGVYKERLSQSALVAEMKTVATTEAQTAMTWLTGRGLTFNFGEDPETDLTPDQTLEQLKMYVAAVRIAHRFGCDAIGIQYQQGLKDSVPASDLAEGLLNNPERPPVYAPDGHTELYAGRALPHFNEVDEGAGLDAVITARVWQALGLEPSSTLHDLRWGEDYGGEFVWVLQISGAAPASHFVGGYSGASSHRQPPMYFRLGGGTLRGVGKAGEVVWSRVYVQSEKLHADVGLGRVLELPDEEVHRRSQATTPQWPVVNIVFRGVGRDQMMAKHQANHVSVAYAPDAASGLRALQVKAAMLASLGLRVNVCGVEPSSGAPPGSR